jgi:CheY-like chemotaxis protein
MSLRVLLAEDDPDIQFVAEAALLRSGVDVTTVCNGPAALAAVNLCPPDAVLLDCRMPGMDGLEVCRRLKHNPATAHVPVVLLTAARGGDIERGLALGACGYLTKPFNALTLGDELRAILS